MINLSKDRPKVLLFGYNGANNTGAEARLLSIIDDVRAVFGPSVEISVPTLNEKNLRRYLKEESTIGIVPIPSIFLFAIRRLVREHDLILLVEGSCYMDTWTSALLWAFLWATRCASAFKKSCIAYAVDAGELSSLNRYFVRKEASKTDLIITRTEAAESRLESIEVTAPIKSTADTAFTFQTQAEDKDILARVWPEADNGVAGLAAVDFYLWPVVIRPWGRKQYCYKWPYYFSRSKSRRQAGKELAAHWAGEADRIVERYGKHIALICMEELDEMLALEIKKGMYNHDKVRIFSARQYNASEMTSILRSLDLLVTSRYHAAVLSLESAIPQIAVGHDTRLKALYQDLGLYEDYFLEHSSEDIWVLLKNKIDALMENPKDIRQILKKGYQEHLARANSNPKLLKGFLKTRGFKVMP